MALATAGSSFSLAPAEATLGLAAVLGALSRHAHTPLGRARAASLPVHTDPQTARAALQRAQEAHGLAQEGLGVPLPAEDDPMDALALAERGGVLDGVRINACAAMARAGLSMASFAITHSTRAPALCRVARLANDDAQALRTLASTAGDALDEEGRLLDEASEELRRLRHEARQARQRIRTRLTEMMLEPQLSPWLQDQYIALRHDRHCLPIVASFQSKVGGIVHGASQSGQTLLIEPAETVALGNHVAVLDIEAQQEEERLLALLSEEVAAVAPVVRAACAQLAELDVAQASATLMRRARLIVPTLVAATDELALRELRHPMLNLLGKPVVGNDVTLGGDGHGLVISGPNAGGKTAVLTACGLASAMAQRGLPIAAQEGSRLPFFAGSVVILGDGQSLAEGLSSFSSHLKALDEAVATASRGWLVLIDEIGAATDPTEGGAIAQATMQMLVEAGATVLVSTHLEALKALPLSDARFVNARMAVDRATLRPTYRLELGHSGQSFALDAAARLPMAPALLARARAVLAEQPSQWRQALSALERERDDVAREQEKLSRTQQRLQSEHQQALADAQREQAAASTRYQQEIESLRQQVQEALSAFRRERDEQKLASVVSSLRDQARQHRAQSPATPAPNEAPARPSAGGALREGASVWIDSLGQRGEVQSLSSSHATVSVGAMRIRVGLSELKLSAAARPKGADGPKPATIKVHTADADASLAPGSAALRAPGRLDVRGLRAEACEKSLERALDVSLSEGASELWIVHGHGTGALRQQVRQQLEHSHYVVRWRPGDTHEGGDGVTIAALDA